MLKVQPRAKFERFHQLGALFTGGKVLVADEGRRLLTATGEDVHVMDLQTGRRVFLLKGDSEVITSFAVRPRHKDQPHHHLVTASRSLQLTLWDLESGQLLRTWKAHEAPVLMMEFDPSGTLLATGSADSMIKCWDLDKAICTHTLRGHGGVVSALKFHPDPNRWMLFSGSDDCQVRVWDLLTKSCQAVLSSHVSVIRGLDVAPDGWTLISGSRDKVVNVWDLRGMQLIRTLPILETIESIGIVTGESLLIGNDKTYFFTAGDKGVLRFWDLETGACIREQPEGTHHDSELTDAFLVSEMKSIVAVTSDQNILFYSIEKDLDLQKQIIGYNDEVIDMEFIGENKSKMVVITNCGQIRLFDLMNGDTSIVYAHDQTILSMDYMDERSLLCTGAKDHNAKLWRLDLESGMQCFQVAECVGHAEAIGAVAFSKRSLPGFVMTSSQDLTVKKWALTSKIEKSTEVQRLKAMYTVKVHDKEVNAIDVSPNDKLFATGSQDKTAKLWNTEDGSLVATLKGHRRGVWSVKFSPVDQLLATSSGDKTIKLWSLNDMTCVRTFEGHTNSVLRVKFLSLGTQMLSVGSDGLTKLWNVKTSECVSTMDDHDDKIWALAIREPSASILSSEDTVESKPIPPFSVDSPMHCVIATGGGDALINLYRDTTAVALRELHEEQETRMLQEQDLSNYLLKKDYKNAVLLAMRLGQPGRLCALFSEILESSEKEEDAILGKRVMDQIIAELTPKQLETMLGYVRTWNANSKLSRTAQVVLFAMMKQIPPRKLLDLPNIKEILDSLIPYTERHYSRTDVLQTKTWLVDYTLGEMDLILGEPMDEEEEQEDTEEDEDQQEAAEIISEMMSVDEISGR